MIDQCPGLPMQGKGYANPPAASHDRTETLATGDQADGNDAPAQGGEPAGDDGHSGVWIGS